MDLPNLISSLGFDHPVVQAFLILLAFGLVDLLQRKVIERVRRRTDATRTMWDDALVGAIDRPLSLLIWLFAITIAAQTVFREQVASLFGDESLLGYVDYAWDIGLVLVIAWFALRFVAGVERCLLVAAAEPGDRMDRTTVEALGKLLRASIIIVAVLLVLQNLGVNLGAVLAFGGIGGLAIGLAAKDMLANFFGGLTIYLDRPFKVGDWILSPDRTIEGTVEKIGWRQTTIRKFDKRPLYVPNATFSTIAVENPSRMTHRRINVTVGVRYADVNEAAAIAAAIRQMLAGHEEIAADQTLIVNVNEFAASSVDIFIYAFTKTKDWVRYHEVREDVLLKIESIIADHGAEIAFPTSTVHLSTPPQLAGLVEADPEQESRA